MKFNFSQSYFESFQLEASFAIDTSMLSDNYQQLQTQYHPDRFVNGSDQEKRIAMQITTYINEGYEVLKDEQMRARYLLQLEGIAFDEEKDTTQDMEFLMAQMALREEIDEVGQQSDPLTALDKLDTSARQQKAQLIQTYQSAFAEKDWAQAKETVLKLQFFKRLRDQISAKQEALEDELI